MCLEDVTVPMYPVIARIKNDMISQGAYNAMMSGSGPTVFGIFPDEQTALKCKEYLKAQERCKAGIYNRNILSIGTV